MGAQALENAKKRREEMAAEQNRVAARLDELRRMLARIDQFVADHEAFEADELPKEPPAGDLVSWTFRVPRPNLPRANMTTSLASPPKPRNSKKEEVAVEAREIIIADGRPIQRPDLLKRLLERGLVIAGTAPETVLSTMLWRTRDSHQIAHLRGAGYWLKERPWLAANYDPDLDELMGVADDTPPEGISDGDAEDE